MKNNVLEMTRDERLKAIKEVQENMRSHGDHNVRIHDEKDSVIGFALNGLRSADPNLSAKIDDEVRKYLRGAN